MISNQVYVLCNLVGDRQSNFDDLAHLFNSGALDFGVRLASNECQRHQGHNAQTDEFVEISYEEGFHCCGSEEDNPAGELVL